MADSNLKKMRFGLTARKKFGKPGMEDVHDIFGIYRERVLYGKRYRERMPFYEPTNPRTEKQQANRQKIADAVLAWQNLTEQEKNNYNKEARFRQYTGYNLFVKRYLKNN